MEYTTDSIELYMSKYEEDEDYGDYEENEDYEENDYILELYQEKEFEIVKKIYNAIMIDSDQTARNTRYQYYLTPTNDSQTNPNKYDFSISRRLSRLIMNDNFFCSEDQYDIFVKKIKIFMNQQLYALTLSDDKLRDKWINFSEMQKIEIQ